MAFWNLSIYILNAHVFDLGAARWYFEVWKSQLHHSKGREIHVRCSVCQSFLYDQKYVGTSVSPFVMIDFAACQYHWYLYFISFMPNGCLYHALASRIFCSLCFILQINDLIIAPLWAIQLEFFNTGSFFAFAKSLSTYFLWKRLMENVRNKAFEASEICIPFCHRCRYWALIMQIYSNLLKILISPSNRGKFKDSVSIWGDAV